MNLNQKLRIIEDLGISFVYIIKFTKNFSNITATEFMSKIIIPKFPAKNYFNWPKSFFWKK